MVDMLHSQMHINVTLSHIVVLIFLLLIVQPYFKSRLMLMKSYQWCSRWTSGFPSYGWRILWGRSSRRRIASSDNATVLTASCGSESPRGCQAGIHNKHVNTTFNYIFVGSNWDQSLGFLLSDSWRRRRRTSCSSPCPRPARQTAPGTSWPCSCGWPWESCSVAASLWRCWGADLQSPQHHGWSLEGQWLAISETAPFEIITTSIIKTQDV